MKTVLESVQHSKKNWHSELFNKVFNPETGEETVSFYVGPIGMIAIGYAADKEDAKGYVKYTSCCFIGRSADLDRCRAVAIREHEDGRVEIRLRFGPPWYWSQISDARRQQSAERPAGT